MLISRKVSPWSPPPLHSRYIQPLPVSPVHCFSICLLHSQKTSLPTPQAHSARSPCRALATSSAGDALPEGNSRSINVCHINFSFIQDCSVSALLMFGQGNFLLGGRGPVFYGIFRNIPGLYPLHASTTPLHSPEL